VREALLTTTAMSSHSETLFIANIGRFMGRR
jgi:hypothetical protein